MLHLLTETSVFLSLPNGCLCQVTGIPVIFVTPIVQNDQTLFSLQPCEKGETVSNKKRSFPAVDKEERPCKRQKLANFTSSRSDVKSSKTSEYVNPYQGCQSTNFYRSTPADIVIMRARIFYSRPNFVPHTNCILVGLPLNRRFLTLY
jgi:telomerase reverse transcriptase